MKKSIRRAAAFETFFAAVLAMPAVSLASGLRYDYHAPEDCPGLEAFQSAVSRRIEGLPPESIPDYGLSVRIEPKGAGGFIGTVRLTETGGGDVERFIAARQCDELVDALSLVVAVVLNPQERESMPSVIEPTVPTALTEPSADVESLAVGPTQVAFQLGNAPNHARFGLGALFAGSVERGGVPGTVLAPRLGVRGTVQPQPDSIELGLGLSMALPTDEKSSTAEPRAKFRLDAVRFEGCSSFRLRPALRFGPCAAFEVGRLKGSSEVTSTVVGSKSWLSPGALLRGHWQASEFVGIYADFGVMWPLVRSAFYFNQPAAPSRIWVVHSVPSRTYSASVGLTVHLL